MRVWIGIGNIVPGVSEEDEYLNLILVKSSIKRVHLSFAREDTDKTSEPLDFLSTAVAPQFLALLLLPETAESLATTEASISRVRSYLSYLETTTKGSL